jgi:hypothetical protein
MRGAIPRQVAEHGVGVGHRLQTLCELAQRRDHRLAFLRRLRLDGELVGGLAHAADGVFHVLQGRDKRFAVRGAGGQRGLAGQRPRDGIEQGVELRHVVRQVHAVGVELVSVGPAAPGPAAREARDRHAAGVRSRVDGRRGGAGLGPGRKALGLGVERVDGRIVPHRLRVDAGAGGVARTHLVLERFDLVGQELTLGRVLLGAQLGLGIVQALGLAFELRCVARRGPGGRCLRCGRRRGGQTDAGERRQGQDDGGEHAERTHHKCQALHSIPPGPDAP